MGKSKDLAGLADVELFGLDEFGALPEGKAALLGAAAGGALQSGAAWALRKMAANKREAAGKEVDSAKKEALLKSAQSYDDNAELGGVGIAVGLGALGLLSKKTKDAAWMTMVSGVSSGLVRVLEKQMAKSSETKGYYGVEMERIPTLSGVVVEDLPTLGGHGGLGLTTMQNVPTLSGASDMPQLVGSSLQGRSDQVTLLGGPTINGMAGHFGATLFGGN